MDQKKIKKIHVEFFNSISDVNNFAADRRLIAAMGIRRRTNRSFGICPICHSANPSKGPAVCHNLVMETRDATTRSLLESVWGRICKH